MHPELESIAKDKLAEVETLQYSETPEKFAEAGIMGTPTLVLIEDGKETDRIVGGLAKQGIILRFNLQEKV